MKNRQRKFVSMLIILALLLVEMNVSVTADAIIDNIIYTGIIHLEDRSEEIALKVVPSKYEGVDLYFKHGDFTRSWYHCIDGGIATNGCVWILDAYPVLIVSYSLYPEEGGIDAIYRENVESLIFEGSGSQAVVVGYKTLSGEEYPLPDFEEVKRIVEVESSMSEPSYVPLSNSTSTPTPMPAPTPTPAPIPTQTPNPTKKPIVKNPKAVQKITTSKTKTTIYSNGKLISKLVLKNGTLTWKKGTKKAKTYKNVKCVGTVEKSKDFYFMNKKKDVVWQVSFKTGKKKRFVRKGAKKFIYKRGYLVQIKTKSKKLDMRNK